MIAAALWNVIVFAVLAVVVGAACAPKIAAPPVLRLAVGIGIALGAYFVIGFTAFAASWPNGVGAALAASTGILLLVLRWRRGAELAADPDVRQAIAGWTVLVAWSLGLLALVVTYSGGGWAVDWIEHWERTELFLQRKPADTTIVGIYTFTARPPLVNCLVALALESTRPVFAHYQIAMTLLGTLVLFPAWSLAERWRPKCGWWIVLLLMLSPLFAQNITFPWTKLPTVFFVLAAVHLLLASLDGTEAFARRAWAGVLLGIGFLAHFSAGPWIIALAAGLLAAECHRWRERSWWRENIALGAVTAVLPALWFAWSAAQFGLGGSIGTNTTASAWQKQTARERVTVPLLNLRDTVVPLPFRSQPRDRLGHQRSLVGWVRDAAFNVYQTNLIFALGLGGLSALGFRWLRRRRMAGRGADPGARFLRLVLPIAILAGVWVHTLRDVRGLVHICLQPLVVLGLAAAAAELAGTHPARRAPWACLAAIDFTLGIALQFAIESWLAVPWVAADGTARTYIESLSLVAKANAMDKWALGYEFFADLLPAPAPAIGLWLALCAAFTIVRIRNTAAGGP